MRWWETPVGGPVRGRLIALIRRGVDTVEALAAELQVTDNAVRAQLAILEREGLVERSGVRHGGKVGKPATVYSVAASAEPVLSAAHRPVLQALVSVLKERLPAPARMAVLREVGRRLAAAPHRKAGSVDAGARSAAKVLRQLGAEVRVEKTREGTVVRGFACPLADIVSEDPHVCTAVEELVSTVAGTPARQRCEHGDRPRCRFVFEKD